LLGKVMIHTSQIARRWDPTPSIPAMCAADFVLHSAYCEEAKVTLLYSNIVGNPKQDLHLWFKKVIAFRTYWDGDGVGRVASRPANLVNVENSSWLADGDFGASIATSDFLGVITHYHLVTLHRSLDLLARGPVTATWRPSASK
jgi:hypothetical protein